MNNIKRGDRIRVVGFLKDICSDGVLLLKNIENAEIVFEVGDVVCHKLDGEVAEITRVSGVNPHCVMVQSEKYGERDWDKCNLYLATGEQLKQFKQKKAEFLKKQEEKLLLENEKKISDMLDALPIEGKRKMILFLVEKLQK